MMAEEVMLCPSGSRARLRSKTMDHFLGCEKGVKFAAAEFSRQSRNKEQYTVPPKSPSLSGVPV